VLACLPAVLEVGQAALQALSAHEGGLLEGEELGSSPKALAQRAEEAMEAAVGVAEVLAPLLELRVWEEHQWQEGLPRLGLSHKWEALALLGALVAARWDADLVLPRLGLRCLETFLGW
jgi:hypothetical protein